MAQINKFRIGDASAFAERMYPFIYLIYSQHGAYDFSSLTCCHLADMIVGGLGNKRVLDIGCGFGTTTRKAALFGPSAIVATDISEPMVSLMRHIYFGDDPNLLEQAHVQEALGTLNGYVRSYIKGARAEFAGNVFTRRGGKLDIKRMSSFDLLPSNVGEFDAAVASNSIHWPISELRGAVAPNEETVVDRMNAVTETLKPIAAVIRKGGALVFSTSENFVEDDVDLSNEADIMTSEVRNHPVSNRFEDAVFRILRERHGLEKQTTVVRPKVIQLSWMKEACACAGFMLCASQYQENYFGDDALISEMTGTPMLLGGYGLAWREIIDIMDQARDEVGPKVTAEERAIKMCEHHYTFALERL